MKRNLLIAVMLLGFSSNALAQNQTVPEAPFGLSSLEVFSIFNQNFTNRDYHGAIDFGRWLLVAHPKQMDLPGNARYSGDRTFNRMITVYQEIGKQISDPIAKASYVDSARTLYNRVFDIFSAEEIDMYRWRFEFGRFFQVNTNILNNNALAAEQYRIMYALDADRLVKEANGYYIQFIISLMVADGDRDGAIALMAETEPMAGPETLEYYNSVRDRLFSNPEERIVFLEEIFGRNQQDIATLNELFDLYVRTNNREKIASTSLLLYELNPSYANTMRMAAMAANNANYNEAIRFLQEALTKTEDRDQRKETTLQIANNYMNQENLQQARTFARRAIEIDGSWGLPYMRIADIYAQAVSRCAGGSMTREDKVVYWLVLDYLDRAKNTDASVRQAADRQIRTYLGVVPTGEEKFFMTWNPGDRIRVDGSLKECYAWIGETTTVR